MNGDAEKFLWCWLSFPSPKKWADVNDKEKGSYREKERKRERGVPHFHSSPREEEKCRMQQQRDDWHLDKCKTQPEASLVQGADTSKLQLHSRENFWMQLMLCLFLTKCWILRMSSHSWPRSRHYSCITMGERREEAKKKAAHPTHKTFTAFDPSGYFCEPGRGWSVRFFVKNVWMSHRSLVLSDCERGSGPVITGVGQSHHDKKKKQNNNNNKTETRFWPERMNQSVCHHSETRLKRLQWCSNRTKNRNRKALWN